MNNIKAIAFDLGGVLLRENDYPLSSAARILEKEFGRINNNDEYYAWAVKTMNLPRAEIIKIVENTVENIYELREPDIFDRLPKLKLAIASNHLSVLNKWLDKAKINSKFDYTLLSADIGIGKPNKKFYEILISKLREKPEDILFVDDNAENIEGAKKSGLSVLYYDNSKNLTDEILHFLK